VTLVMLRRRRAMPAIALLAFFSLGPGCGKSPSAPIPNPPATNVAAGPAERTGAGAPSRPAPRSEPFSPRNGGAGDHLFESVDAASIGIDYVHRVSTKPGALRANTVGIGVCMGDYDGDGRTDLYICDSTVGGALYRNLGDFRFDNVTEKAGLTETDHWSTGASFVDVEGDGDLDLYVCGFECVSKLYVNQGDGTFVERAKEFGLDFDGSGTVMTWADYDIDGDLDAYLVTNFLPPREEIEYRLTLDAAGRPSVPRQYREYHDTIAMPNNEYGVVESGQFDHFYRNNGDKTFTDVTGESGVSTNYKGLAATWWDYNDDGLPDLYVANDFYGPDHLYRNQGDGTFVDEAKTALPHMPWFSMGCDLGDVNNDGLIDFVGSDMAGTTYYRERTTTGDMEDDAWFLDSADPPQYMRNTLYVNAGVGRMMESALMAGIGATNWTWTFKLMDLDLDGRLDLFVTNGMNRDWENSDLHRAALEQGPPNSPAYDKFWADLPVLAEPDMAFRNRGDLRFEDVSAAWGVDYTSVSYGAAFGDLDNDGDLDIVVANMGEKPSVYRNSQSTGHAVTLRLQGIGANPGAIGAKATLRAGGMMHVRYLTPVRGFMSGDEPALHFGLGDAERIESVVVQWPNGARDEFRDLAADCIYTIKQDAAAPKAAPRQPLPRWYSPSKRNFAAVHRERPFDDWAEQKLLPRRLSTLGPGIAVADVTGDGRDEILVTGARGMPNRLLRADAAGDFVLHELFSVWDDDQDAEALGAVFFDADSDGDQDLYVASGGVEAPAGDPLMRDPLMRDHLYLNDGAGRFARAPNDALPELADSGGAMAAADFDRDGDLDLFVAGRCVPGAYPTTPASRLLENQGGKFSDATDKVPGLGDAGMATGAVWSDANGDGWVDLLVTYEWGPVRLFLNDSGKLRDATDDAGLAERLGWWNGIAGRDLDNDGDVDYVVTNFGLNTKYQATAERPQRLFYGDFEGLDRPETLEASTDAEGRLWPMRGKGAMEQGLAMVAQMFPTYDAYAKATLADLVTQPALDKALALSANTLESGVLLNDGAAKFEFRPLPRLAQIAPSFGVALEDANADGLVDIYLVQNFRGGHREIGHMDGGMSLLLRGDGKGNFEPVLPNVTGLVVPGDGRSVATTDLDGNGRPDFVVGVNNEQTVGFELQRAGDGQHVRVRLQGPAGNPTGVGARVTLKTAGGQSQTAEVTAGGGYLSQSSATLFFGLPPDAKVAEIEVRWPDGKTTRHPGRADAREYKLAQ
jgi:hypothetical protein